MCNFRDPNLVTFYIYKLTHFFKLNEEHFTLHLQTTNILVRLLTINKKHCLTPKNPKMRDPIIVNPIQMQPYLVKGNTSNPYPFILIPEA